jgi:hypothetical protein
MKISRVSGHPFKTKKTRPWGKWFVPGECDVCWKIVGLCETSHQVSPDGNTDGLPGHALALRCTRKVQSFGHYAARFVPKPSSCGLPEFFGNKKGRKIPSKGLMRHHAIKTTVSAALATKRIQEANAKRTNTVFLY